MCLNFVPQHEHEQGLPGVCLRLAARVGVVGSNDNIDAGFTGSTYENDMSQNRQARGGVGAVQCVSSSTASYI
jgi:hypothetical protein